MQDRKYAARPAEQGRLLLHMECQQFGVPYGSRMGPIKKKAEPKAEADAGEEGLV